MEKDLRYKILFHMKSLGNSTEEWHANEYLSTCHSDLGTIIRALVELVDEGLIFNCYDRNKSIHYQDLSKIDTSNKKNGINAKNPLRFNDVKNQLNCSEEIKAVRLYITLKGLMFLQEKEKFKLDKINSGRTKNWFYLLLAITIAVGVGNVWDKFFPTHKEIHIMTKPLLQSEKECSQKHIQNVSIDSSSLKTDNASIK